MLSGEELLDYYTVLENIKPRHIHSNQEKVQIGAHFQKTKSYGEGFSKFFTIKCKTASMGYSTRE